jgi:DNA primase small subunit
MPHSVSPNDSPRPDGEDEVLPDAPPVDIPAKEEDSEMDTAKPTVKLEDMFNGDEDEDEDDEEFPASSAADTKMESSPPPQIKAP